MRYLIYVMIYGLDFDPIWYDNKLPTNLRGSVNLHEKISREIEVRCWRSKKIETTCNPEISLQELIDKLKPYLMTAAKLEGISISAQIVMYLGSSEIMRGFYISGGLAQALVDIQADLDIDIVHDLVLPYGSL